MYVFKRRNYINEKFLGLVHTDEFSKTSVFLLILHVQHAFAVPHEHNVKFHYATLNYDALPSTLTPGKFIYMWPAFYVSSLWNKHDNVWKKREFVAIVVAKAPF